MSLKDIYAKAWAESRGLSAGWIVNMEPTFNLAIGSVGVVRDGEFNYESSLEQRKITGLQLDTNQKRQDTPWQFQSSDQIRIDLSSGAETANVPVNANFSLTVSFGNEAGVSSHGTAMWWNSYADMGVVRAGIVAAARDGRLTEGQSIVVAQQLTGKGIVFSAEGSNASLSAAAAVNAPGGVLPTIGSFSGKLSLVNSSAGAQFVSFADGAVLAARVLYLGRKGWFWWRDFEAYGAMSVDVHQVEETLVKPVEGEGDDEYFAMIR